MQAGLGMTSTSIQTEKSTCDSADAVGVQSYGHAHFIKAIRGGIVAIVPNVDAQESPAFKLKSTGSLHGSDAFVTARWSKRTSRFSGSFKEDTRVIDDDDDELMHPDGSMELDEASTDPTVDDMTIGQFIVEHKVKRKRINGTEDNDDSLAGEPGRSNEVDKSHEQSNEAGSDLDEPLIFFRKKHKKRGGSSSSHLSCIKVETKDDRCLVPSVASVEDNKGVMHTATITTGLSVRQTSCWGVPTETENRYKRLISLTSSIADVFKHVTCLSHSPASLQPPCELNSQRPDSDFPAEENVAVLSPLSSNSDVIKNLDSPRKPSVEEPVSLLEMPNSQYQINSGRDLSSGPIQNIPDLSLIECPEDIPHGCGDNSTQINTSEANVVNHLNQHNQQYKDFVADDHTSSFILESQLLGKPYILTAEEGRNTGQSSTDAASFSNTTSDDVKNVCSQDSVPWPQPSSLDIITEKSVLTLSSTLPPHPNPLSSTSNLVGDIFKPDANLDVLKNTYLQSSSVSITRGNLTDLDGSAMNSVKPGSSCEISATIGAHITDVMESGSSGTLDRVPTEDADNLFSSQHNKDQSSADATQVEYSQEYLPSCSSSGDMGSLSCDPPKREKHSSDHMVTEDTPNVSYNKIRSKFVGINGLEGRGPNWRQELELTQAPKRFPSNRKTLSPTAKEKLCLEVNVEELYENMQHYRNRKRLWFDRCTDNSSTSAHKESLLVMSSERGALKSKLPSCQTKGILKTQSGTQENISSSKESIVPVSCSQDAIKFSQRQMRDVEYITSKLLAELKSMKSIMAETLNLEDFSSTPFKGIADKMVLAQDTASAVESTTRKYLSMMNRDLKRFCKIMNSKETGTAASPAATSSSPPKERKIMFADEAGGSLCNIKYFEEPSASSDVPESETVTDLTV